MIRILFFVLLGMIFPNMVYAKTFKVEKFIHQKKMNIEIAFMPKDLKQGLSDRKQLLEDHAMLFVFPQEQTLFFWMYRMHFDLDLIWLDKNCKIVDIFSHQKACQKNDVCPLISSPNLGKYVLEAVSGFSEKNHLKLQEKLEVCSSLNN